MNLTKIGVSGPAVGVTVGVIVAVPVGVTVAVPVGIAVTDATAVPAVVGEGAGVELAATLAAGLAEGDDDGATEALAATVEALTEVLEAAGELAGLELVDGLGEPDLDAGGAEVGATDGGGEAAADEAAGADDGARVAVTAGVLDAVVLPACAGSPRTGLTGKKAKVPASATRTNRRTFDCDRKALLEVDCLLIMLTVPCVDQQQV